MEQTSETQKNIVREDYPKGVEKEFTLREIVQFAASGIRILLRNWKVLLVAGISGCVLGFLIASASPTTYTARVSFVLEDSKGGASGLSALAGQFGFDLGGGGASSILQGDNIIGLLKSRKLTESTLLSPWNEGGKLSLADRYAEVYELRNRWKETERINQEIFFPATGSRNGFSRLQDSLLNIIIDDLSAKLSVGRSDKKMTFYEAAVDLKDENLSKLFTERLVKNAVDFYVETKTRRQRLNVDRLQRRADSIAGLLNYRTYSAAAKQSQVLDINPAFSTATVAAEVSTRDKTMIGMIYAEIVKNLEIQKATLTQETPVIQVVDTADLPLKKNKKSRLIYGLTGGIILFLVTGLLVLIVVVIRRNL